MKKIYLTLALISLIFGLNAQQNISLPLIKGQANTTHIDGLSKALTSNTLMPSTLSTGACGSMPGNVVYYSVPPSTIIPSYTITGEGYVFGTNEYYYSNIAITRLVIFDKVAQKYNTSGNITVSHVIVQSGRHHSDPTTLDPPTSVTAKIYSEHPTTKAPDVQIGTSATKSLDSFTGNDALAFSTHISVPAGNFFVSIESPPLGGTTHDTLAILSTVYGCSSTDSLSWITGTNATAPLPWSSVMKGNPANNLDLLIFPVVDIATGINNSISKGNLTLLAAFPNPANNDVSVNFRLNTSSKVEIDVYDITGKIVDTIKLSNVEAGEHTSKINVSNLNAGVYMYSVKSTNDKLFSKFTVVK